MQKRQTFSVGDLCVDVLQEIRAPTRFNEEHSLKNLYFSIGGNAANFAVIGSKLGLKPKLISAIGKDFATTFLETELANAGVSSMLIKSKEKNAFSIIAINKMGERGIQSVKKCQKEITTKKIERRLLPKLRPNDIVFFGGFYHLQNLRPGFKALLGKIKNHGAVICFDTCFDTTAKWNISPFLKFIDYLFVNNVELRHIATGKTTRQRAGSLFKGGAKCIVVKQGAWGATLFVKGSAPKRFSPVACKIVDTTGAGDAFNAGFVFGLVHNWRLSNCMLAGNFVAGKKIQQHGITAPNRRTVERFIKQYSKHT